MISPKPYSRKPFEVTAEQVTDTNLQDIAEWINGTVKILERGNAPFIEVAIQGPHQPDRVGMAFVGDWVLRRGTTNRVCSDQAFRANYDLAVLSPST
jgi:hypothetical protein